MGWRKQARSELFFLKKNGWATLPYSEFKGFNKIPTGVRFDPDLELSSKVFVAIN
jgi:hypothetical protein